MNTELEDALTDALRAKAGAVPGTPMPRLGTARARRSRLVPIAAAVIAVVVVGVAALVLVPGGDDTSKPVRVASPEELAPGEVYYSLRLTAQADGRVIMEKQLWQSRDRAGEWRQQLAQGASITDGRVVASGRVEARPGGVCYPAFTATEASCTTPASWLNPTPDFLATAPRDPATIGEQFHAEAVAKLVNADAVRAEASLAYVLELKYIGELLAGNGVPAELSSALRQVVAAIPGILMTKDMADLTGRRGTGYSLPIAGPSRILTVIFDADGHYLGSPTEAVRHGVAPGLGQRPSHMID